MLSEVKKLDERKKKVLQAIVEEYVNTAEPVSSNLLTQKDEYRQKKVIDIMLMNY